MSKKHRKVPVPKQKMATITSRMDHMKDGSEFESLVSKKAVNIDLLAEIRKSLAE
jgi:hypothetical protein